MRYDELILPLGASELRLQFHSRFTVLAGLSGAQRRHFIDAITQLHRGALHNGSMTLVDANGRRLVIDELNGLDPAIHPQRSPGAWQSLLTVGAEDLGLPRSSDDPDRVTMKNELEAARRQAEAARAELAAALEERRRHDAAMVELQGFQTHLGTGTERSSNSRARALVELEQARASLVVVDAPPAQIARDARLIEATAEVQHLAEEWTAIGEEADRLEEALAGRPRIDEQDLPGLIGIPDEIPKALTATVAELDRLAVERDELQSELDRTLESPNASTPDDPRVLTLAALDQETLWLSHRDVLLATEALNVAQQSEERRMLVDPTERDGLERAHAATEAAEETAERRWLPSVLAATITVCAAAMFMVTDLWTVLVPLLLSISVVSVVFGVGLPRLRLLQAQQQESALLDQAGFTDLADYLRRFIENPHSERWKRAEQLIEDYQVALQEWQVLVGDITPADASTLEETVHLWVTRTDPTRQDRAVTRLRRDIDHTARGLQLATDRLAAMLDPFGLAPHSTGLLDALQERVAAGHTARLQARLTETRESEKKLTSRLETELAAFGFEDGSLSARISSFGRELDAARHRTHLRAGADDRADLTVRIEQLVRRLSAPEPSPPPKVISEHKGPNATIIERRAHLAERTASFTDPDTGELGRRLEWIEGRISGLESSLTIDLGLVVDNPVDHLVETLVRYRPVWPTTESEPAPALLDDPFAGTGSELKCQLLDAVVEVARLVQVILLTDDRVEIEWAREAERRGVLSLIEPGPRRR